MQSRTCSGYAERSRKSQSKFSCKRVHSRTIALSQMSKIEFTRIFPWRAIALLRTCSGYAERSRIFVQASAIELAHIAERSRNIELVKIRATYQVAIKTIENVSCIFVKFVGHKNQEQNCLFSTDHLPAKLTDLPTNIFSYTRAGKPVSSPTIRKIVFIISKILFRLI